MLMPISAISAQQAKPTQATMRRVQHFLDYAATKEPAVITYRASDMDLAIHSDAGYLNEEGARSRAGGHHFLSENVASPSNNGAIYNKASIIKAVISSAAEADEIGALYTNARKGVDERNILRVMGHPQPPTPVQTDNSTAEGIGRHHKLTSPAKMHERHGHAIPLVIEASTKNNSDFIGARGRYSGGITG